MRKWFRKLTAVICAGALACTAFAFSVFADDDERCYYQDGAINESEALDCDSELSKASSKQGIDFAAVFLNDSTPDAEVKSLAHEYCNKFSNGAVLVVNYNTRYAYIALTGKAKSKITDSETDKIFKKYVNPKIKNNKSLDAVKAFTKGVDRYMSTFYISGTVILIGVICFIVFFAIMYIAVSSKYKFHEKPNTGAYLEGGDLNYDVMMDTFVSEHTTRTAINTSSESGSGGSHSGGGGSHF